MREEYKIKRGGRDYVLYPGLLNEVHEMFQTFSLETELLERGDQPLVKATFQGWLEGLDYPIKTNGHGMAGRKSDKSGAPAEAPIEMAETRAKARALRDAVNVGETAFEELSQVEESGATEKSRTSQRAHQPKRGATLANESSKVTKATLDEMKVMLFEDAKYRGVSLDQRIEALQKHIDKPIDEMTEHEAQGWISQFEQIFSHRQEIQTTNSS